MKPAHKYLAPERLGEALRRDDVLGAALGLLARRPEIRWRRQEADIRKLSRLQQKLLAAAADRVGPNGILVYSTCTLEPEENERIVEAFLNRRPDFRLEPASDLLGPSLAGPYLQILPHHHGGDGAFAARLCPNRRAHEQQQTTRNDPVSSSHPIFLPP